MAPYLHPHVACPLLPPKTIMLAIFALFLAPILARAALYALGNEPRSWRDADWSSTGALPPAADYQPARVVVFTGTTGAWKGIFSVHSWVVFKRAERQAAGPATTWSAGAIRCAPTAGRPTGAGTATCRWRSPTCQGAEAEKLIPRIEAAVKAYHYAPRRRLSHLAGAEQQQLHRRDPARRAGTGRRAAAECGRPRLPRRLLRRPDRQRHRRRAQPRRLCRREDRLGRGHRGQSARPGRRARPAPSGVKLPGFGRIGVARRSRPR